MKTKNKPKHEKARAKDSIIAELGNSGLHYTKTWLDAVISGRGNANIKLAKPLSAIVGGDEVIWMDPERAAERKEKFLEYVCRKTL